LFTPRRPMEGYLSKKSRLGAADRVWQRRWFVLDGTGLRWFEDESKRGDAKGAIGLAHLESAGAAAHKSPTRFLVRCRASAERGAASVYDFEAPSSAAMGRWVEAVGRLVCARGAREGGGGSGDAALCGEPVEERLAAVPGNGECADCMSSDPKRQPLPAWASTNLGVVFCIRCSGAHRKLGTHLSKVLSIKIDRWSDEQLAWMERLGNAQVNAELEAGLPAGVKPDLVSSSAEQVEAFIRAKYELGSFLAGGDGFVPPAPRRSLQEVGMIEFAGLLFVQLVAGSHLRVPNAWRTASLHCEFRLGERRARSRRCRGSPNPVWGEELAINRCAADEALLVRLIGADLLGRTECLGEGRVRLDDLPREQPTGVDLPLLPSSESARTKAPSLGLVLTYNPLS